MRGVLLWSALLALILSVLIVGVVRLTGMVVRRIWGRTKNLTAERCFAEAVAAGDFDRAEQQAAFLPRTAPGASGPLVAARADAGRGIAGRLDPAAPTAVEPAAPQPPLYAWYGRWLLGLPGVWPWLGCRVSKVARRSAMPARVQDVMTIEVVVAQPTTPVNNLYGQNN